MNIEKKRDLLSSIIKDIKPEFKDDLINKSNEEIYQMLSYRDFVYLVFLLEQAGVIDIDLLLRQPKISIEALMECMKNA